jgi:GxxExxY protein
VSRSDFDITGQIVDAAMKVHSALGPGLLESAYAVCMQHELQSRGLAVERETPLAVHYGGVRLDAGYRLDLLVESRVVVELKAVSKVLPIHEAQVISYLRLGRYQTGLLLNFHVRQMRDGVNRYVHGA